MDGNVEMKDEVNFLLWIKRTLIDELNQMNISYEICVQ